MAGRAFFRPPYSDPATGCLRRVRAGRLLAAAAAVGLALCAGGCSYSYKLGSLFGDDKSDKTAPVTPASEPKPASGASADGDLAIAKAAAAELLAQGGKDLSLPWQNPRTGAHGTVTPIASTYTKGGLTCHDFLASHVQGDKQSWYQGDACRIHGGRWEVRDIRPLQRT
jgi:outer membrane surface antigen